MIKANVKEARKKKTLKYLPSLKAMRDNVDIKGKSLSKIILEERKNKD